MFYVLFKINKLLKRRLSGKGLSHYSSMSQALVVLVHDMGPNWELVSDAVNSTLQFKVMVNKYGMNLQYRLELCYLIYYEVLNADILFQ